MKRPPTAERVRELFHYSPTTGVLTRRASSVNIADIGKPVGYAAGNDGRYVGVRVDACPYGAHRIAWLHFYGEWPDGMVDHINGIGTDNRIFNLRLVDCLENMRNKRRASNNTSGVVGVDWRASKGTWRAYIVVNRRQISLGHHPTKAEAVAARKAGEAHYGFHQNHGRG